MPFSCNRCLLLSNKKEKRAKENNVIAYVDGAAISSEIKKARLKLISSKRLPIDT